MTIMGCRSHRACDIRNDLEPIFPHGVISTAGIMFAAILRETLGLGSSGAFLIGSIRWK
jgi:hypothetical protein